MFVHKPTLHSGQWIIMVTESVSPLSNVIERVPFGSRETAWQQYRKMRMEKLVDFDATVLHETERAYLLTTGGMRSAWIPKTIAQNNDDGTFTMPEKWATEKGLI